MSLLGGARKIWRSALPEPIRKLAAPALNRVLEAYVRAAARAPAASPSKHSTGAGDRRHNSPSWSSVSAVPSGATAPMKPA